MSWSNDKFPGCDRFPGPDPIEDLEIEAEIPDCELEEEDPERFDGQS